MKRPLALTLLMWFTGIYASGATIGILAVIVDAGRHYSIGGVPVSREKWLIVAAPLVASIAALMGVTAIGLRRHRAWARAPFMFIWPVIVIFAIVEGLLGAVTWSLARCAVIDAAAFGLGFAWLLFRYKPSVAYFRDASG